MSASTLLLTRPFYHRSLFESINLRLPYPFAVLSLIVPTSFLLIALFYSFSRVLTSFSERFILIIFYFIGIFTPLRFFYLCVNFQHIHLSHFFFL